MPEPLCTHCHEIDGEDVPAVAACRCGEQYCARCRTKLEDGDRAMCCPAADPKPIA